MRAQAAGKLCWHRFVLYCWACIALHGVATFLAGATCPSSELHVRLSQQPLFDQLDCVLLAFWIAVKLRTSLVLPLLPVPSDSTANSQQCTDESTCFETFRGLFALQDKHFLGSCLLQHHRPRTPAVRIDDSDAEAAVKKLRATLEKEGEVHLESSFCDWRPELPHKAWLEYISVRQEVLSNLWPSDAILQAMPASVLEQYLPNVGLRRGSSEHRDHLIDEDATLADLLLPRQPARLSTQPLRAADSVHDPYWAAQQWRGLRARYFGRPLLQDAHPSSAVTCEDTDWHGKSPTLVAESLKLAEAPLETVLQELRPRSKLMEDLYRWTILVLADSVVSACTSTAVSWALESRKVHGLPFLDLISREAGLQRLSVASIQSSRRSTPKLRPLRICIWGYLTSGPWGGGAHFLLALSRSFERLGHEVCNIDNTKRDKELFEDGGVDLHIVVHSLAQVPSDLAQKLLPEVGASTPRVIFRTDGPQALARGTPRPDEDVALFQHIKRYATTATVFQSEWSYNATLNLGHRPVNPVIIGNAPDPVFYHRLGRRNPATFSKVSHRIKLCMSVWSDGPRKNWPLIQFLDANLDQARYELTLVGRLPSQYRLRNVTHVPPVKQRHLGGLLRQMDIFIAPSYNECFSNAETQALACGIPVLALRDSSHTETIGGAGRYFTGTGDVLQELEALVANYQMYASRAVPNDIDEVAIQFLIAAGLA